MNPDTTKALALLDDIKDKAEAMLATPNPDRREALLFDIDELVVKAKELLTNGAGEPPRGSVLAEELRDAVAELLDVAGLRGDDQLPHPANDPKPWTARMQEAWDDLHAKLAAFDERAAHAPKEGWVSVTLRPWEESSFGEQIVTPNDPESPNLAPGVYQMRLVPIAPAPTQEGEER